MIALCPACHEAKHIGAAAERGDAEPARVHLGEVNGWDTATLDAYLTDAFDQWQQRSRHAWQLDVERLADYGIDPPGGDRLDEAEPGTLTIREVSVEETLENFFSRSRP